jgi:hypothetical protein
MFFDVMVIEKFFGFLEANEGDKRDLTIPGWAALVHPVEDRRLTAS